MSSDIDKIIPLGTVKVWINQYKKEHDISQQVLKDDVAFSESELIKIEKKYKTREKIPVQTMEQRINQLEMEPTIKKSIGKWKKVKKIFLAKKHSKASYLQIAGLRYKN